MLKELRLTNLVLIESAVISFSRGFNVLSGESGSGKSAILNALNLIAGERCDPSLVRLGADKGGVEAIFDISSLSRLQLLLENSGIDHDNELFSRREIAAAGKSRAFINHQPAQLAFLREISSHLFEIIGQHANQKLRSLDTHRLIVDLFGGIQTSSFTQSWEEEKHTRQKLQELIQTEAQRLRDIEICQMEIEELQEANLKEGEEEELFAEYTQLSNADTLLQKVGELLHTLCNDKAGVLPQLNRQQTTLKQLLQLVPTLNETASNYENAKLELQEIAHTLRLFESRIEHNPQKTSQLNQRLTIIDRMKRKYGPTINDAANYLKNAQERLSQLKNADADIELLQKTLTSLTEKTNQLSANLSTQRQITASKLKSSLTSQLRTLNMPKVEFHIDISPQHRSNKGDDRVEFTLTPNLGEHRIPLKDCASGGELSRTLLAIQVLLAGKEHTPTLIFDEVDANIGGETAAIVGEKLKEIGQQHQVLCITHFPQVAKQAEHHLRISKQEINGRTLTLVTSLDDNTQRLELLRMGGGGP